MEVRAEKILSELWDVYGMGVLGEICNNKYLGQDIIDEFFFVLLGGFGISFEQNLSALNVIKKKGFIDCELYCDDDIAYKTSISLKKELSCPQFEPLTREGKFRKYRFVETKPTVISLAGLWMWKECKWNVLEKIETMKSSEVRVWLCDCPGIGMKSASWLLRNVGLNDDCAVFDVHIMRFLSKIGFDVPAQLTEKTYLQLEDNLRNVCANIGTSLGNLDYLLWVLSRNGFLAHVG